MNVTAIQRRRYEVPLLQWQHWLPGGRGSGKYFV